MTPISTGSAYYLFTEPLGGGATVTCQYVLHRPDYPGGAAWGDYPIEASDATVLVDIQDLNYQSFGSVEVNLDKVTPDFLKTAPEFDRSIC